MLRVGKVRTFLADDTALTMHNVSTEIDRYISWPGTAFGYKVGELTVNHYGRKRKLNSALNLMSEIFNVVIKQGAIPLDVLE